MSPPTPETTSIIVAASGSTRTDMPRSNEPALSQVNAVESSERSPASRAHIAKNVTAAPPKATNTDSVEMTPAVRHEIVSPRSVITRAPASGASRQIQAPTVMPRRSPSAVQLAEAVDVERELAPGDRHDQAEADADLGRGDSHDGEREHLPVELAEQP